MMNKRIIAVITALILILALATVAWAQDIIVPTGPNSGPSIPTHIGNSGMTVTPSTPQPSVPQKITIKVNGKEVVSDVAPYITEGRTMVPYRFVAEALGCKVDWDDELFKVTATKGSNVVSMIISAKKIFINNQSKDVDVPPVLKNDRTFVPVRFMSEALGYKVSWEDSTNTVYINE